MEEHRIRTARRARYFTLGRPEREVWFVLHGYGQLAARFLARFEPLDDGRRLIVAPEGLSRFYLTDDPTERRVGATWMTREDRLAEIADYVEYLDAVCADALANVDRARLSVVLLGFSQGSSTACRWATMGSSRIDRLIVWGGEVPPDLDLNDQAAGRLRALKPTLVFGSNDQYFTPKVIAATEQRLRAHAVPYALVPFEGGHDIDAGVLQRLAGT